MKRRILCVIMGGGRGSRLSPLTKMRCKPAVPLAGKYRLIDIPISNCLNSGLNQIFILTQFNTASLHQHIQNSYKFDSFGGGFINILAAEQTETGSQWYQGTADAVRQNLKHFGMKDEDLILILSGDQLYRMDFAKMVRLHEEMEAEVTLAGTPLARKLVHGFGLMQVDDNLRIRAFVEKPSQENVIDELVVGPPVLNKLIYPLAGEQCLVNMGIYLFNAHVLRKALQSEFADFGKEVIPSLLKKMRLFTYLHEGYWEDIGTVRSFFEANLNLADQDAPFDFHDSENPVYTRARHLPPAKISESLINSCLVSDGAVVNKAKLNRSIIGIRSIIGEGTHLDHVIVMGNDYYENIDDKSENECSARPHLGIGKNCRINNSIIDKNCRIGDNVQLSPEGKPDMWETADVLVRDKILIVKKDRAIPAGTVI